MSNVLSHEMKATFPLAGLAILLFTLGSVLAPLYLMAPVRSPEPTDLHG